MSTITAAAAIGTQHGRERPQPGGRAGHHLQHARDHAGPDEQLEAQLTEAAHDDRTEDGPGREDRRQDAISRRTARQRTEAHGGHSDLVVAADAAEHEGTPSTTSTVGCVAR
ncbi:hypothetical protein GCM10020218_059640 [Dactylosporangium vinaceum]